MLIIEFLGVGVLIYGSYQLSVRFLPYTIPSLYAIQRFKCSTDIREWAMITGSSDGIGLAFAKKLLEMNYNLIMHARNKNKMEEILKNFGGENILNISQHIQKYQLPNHQQVIVILQDFSKLQHLDEQKHYENILSQAFQDLQIQELKILINNAGVTEVNLLQNTKQLNDIVSVNCLANCLTSQFALAKNNKITLINVSSFIGGLHPSGYLSVYSASKSFSKTLHESIQQESPQARILNLTPYYGQLVLVSTKMTRYQKLSFETVDTQSVIENTFKLLMAKRNQGCGHWKHEILDLFVNWFPKTFFVPKRMKFLSEVAKVTNRRARK